MKLFSLGFSYLISLSLWCEGINLLIVDESFSGFEAERDAGGLWWPYGQHRWKKIIWNIGDLNLIANKSLNKQKDRKQFFFHSEKDFWINVTNLIKTITPFKFQILSFKLYYKLSWPSLVIIITSFDNSSMLIQPTLYSHILFKKFFFLLILLYYLWKYVTKKLL